MNTCYRRLFMSALTAALAAIGGIGAASDDVVPAPSSSLRVGSYNIRTMHADKRNENAWRLRKNDLISLMRRLDYDVVGLQESFPAQSAYITNSLPDYALIGSIDGAEVEKGVAGDYDSAVFEIERCK